MSKKKQTRTLKVTKQEMAFVEDILDGFDTLSAYRRNWKNSYSEVKARYEVKQIFERSRVKEYMEELLLSRQTEVVTDEKFVLDIWKHIAVKFKDTKPTAANRAGELIGKAIGMFENKKEDSSAKAHREQAEYIYDRRKRMERGEEVEPIEKDSEGKIILFPTKKEGTNDD